jgi:endonuclease YncB( thermonuclease family)
VSLSRNVIKFDPKDRKRKRRPPAQPKKPRKKLGSLTALQAAPIALILLAMGLAAYWILEDTIQEPDTALAQIAGTVTVIDGDTIDIQGDRIRLDGYDAPESGSMCGTVDVYQKASLALADLVRRRTVTCDTKGKDRYNRTIADCEVGGQSIGEYMVEHGWARDWPKYSNREYADEERSARNAKRGIWGLDCPANLWGRRSYN